MWIEGKKKLSSRRDLYRKNLSVSHDYIFVAVRKCFIWIAQEPVAFTLRHTRKGDSDEASQKNQRGTQTIQSRRHVSVSPSSGVIFPVLMNACIINEVP